MKLYRAIFSASFAVTLWGVAMPQPGSAANPSASVAAEPQQPNTSKPSRQRLQEANDQMKTGYLRLSAMKQGLFSSTAPKVPELYPTMWSL
jgi:hypothetical protein